MAFTGDDSDAVALLSRLAQQTAALSIDELREKLSPLFKGMGFRSPIFDPGAFLYRARRVTSSFNTSTPMTIAELKYPPKELAPQGRANRAGRPMFYCSTMKEPLFFEVGELKVGDELILSSWKTRTEMLVNNIGYTNHVFEQLGARRACPTWEDKGGGGASISLPAGGAENFPPVRADNDQLRMELSKLFMRKVDDQNRDDYKLTIAIAEAHFGTIQGYVEGEFAGLMYPSVRMWANGDNIALTPAFVDSNLDFRRATRIRIDKRNPTGFDITSLDCARTLDESGRLEWLGRLLNWKVPPQSEAKFFLKEGRDEDGEYSISKDGKACHWHVTNAVTGEVLEPS